MSSLCTAADCNCARRIPPCLLIIVRKLRAFCWWALPEFSLFTNNRWVQLSGIWRSSLVFVCGGDLPVEVLLPWLYVTTVVAGIYISLHLLLCGTSLELERENTWHTDKAFPSVIASKKYAIHVWFPPPYRYPVNFLHTACDIFMIAQVLTLSDSQAIWDWTLSRLA